MKPKVIDVLRYFLPKYLATNPPLTGEQRRAIWAITNCRTPVMGGHAYQCPNCKDWEFGAHSCNHRSCPQCGSSATTQWIGRELEKRVGAPYFMATFTMPSELRPLFFGPTARDAYDLFFSASSKALAEKLADQKDLRARVSGFTGVLHTWNQKLQFHPHIHYIVPGCGLDEKGNVVTVKNANYLLHLPGLISAFREQVRSELKARGWEVDPVVWTKKWGINLQAFGDGATVIKYLGAYVCRTAIGNSRIISINKKDDTVTFLWKDRSDKKKILMRPMTLSGTEFVKRYLRHVLPDGLRSIRYYGFCHPAARKKRIRIAFHTGVPLDAGNTNRKSARDEETPAESRPGIPKCQCCGILMKRILSYPPIKPGTTANREISKRGPPGAPVSIPTTTISQAR